MTEVEWLTSTNPADMLNVATRDRRAEPSEHGRHVSDRKLRLFACACCLLRGTSAITVDAYEKTRPTQSRQGPPNQDESNIHHTDAEWAKGWTELGVGRPTLAMRAHLLRDIIGNPFRELVGLDACLEADDGHKGDWPTLLAKWRTPTVLSIAKAAYEQRSWDHLPILADALEDADCDNEEILRHLRGEEKCIDCHPDFPDSEFGGGGGTYWCPRCGGTQDMHRGDGWSKLRGPHTRGCHVLDLILNKENECKS